MSDAPSHNFRGDIEGMRGIAVGLVVAFHAGIAHFDGGFIGVDVFFVLSGFLITRLLIDERLETGTISLLGFWSRRARRLLPAACLTLVATLVAAQFILPPLQRRSVTIDGLFSALFLANVRFAESLGDYFGNQLAERYPTPLLHFWSLAVEEQFYLVWPLAVLVAMRFGAKPRRALAGVAILLAVVSFALSIWLTPRRPEVAFYLLPPRMFELLAGALLAIVGRSAVASVPVTVRAIGGWLGLVSIAVATVTYSETTAFPGVAVLAPVLGTVALLVAGSDPATSFGPQRLLAARPLQWIGARSYAIYLWHWPALVFLQARFPDPSLIQRTAAVAASVALAHLSVKFVENPVRWAKSLATPTYRGLALGLALTGCSAGVVGISWATQPTLDGGEAARAVILEPSEPPMSVGSVPVTDEPTGRPSDSGPTTTTQTSSPGTPDNARLIGLEASLQEILGAAVLTTSVPSNLRPSLIDAARDTAQVYKEGCISLGDNADVLDCRYGVQGSDTKFVLFGDSHAAQWFPAMEAVATAHDAELVVLFKGGCPVADVPSTRPELVESCPDWRRAAIAKIREIQPTLVIASSFSAYTSDEELWRTGMIDVLDQVRPATQRLVVLLDTPQLPESPPICLSDHRDSADACVAVRAEVVDTIRADAERAAAAAADAEVIDPTTWLCGPEKCPVIVGDALMYRDDNHLTTVASRLVAPLLDAALFP